MRSAHIKFNTETGFYVIGLIFDNEVKEFRSTNNYHEIGSIISNWIHNGY